MPSNRKPRKKYTPKRVITSGTTDFMVRGLKDIFRTVSLMVEVKLPRGLCDESDMAVLRTHFNWIGFMLTARTYIDPVEAEEAAEVQREAASALQTLIGRNREAKRETFTATAQELNTLREAVAYFDLPLKDALDKAPRHMERDFRAMQIYMAKVHREVQPKGLFVGAFE